MEQIRTTIRMPSGLLEAIEKVRDRKEFPTLSDFIRRAVENFVKEQRRRRLAEECRQLAEEEDLTLLAEADFNEYAGRMARAERGEL